MTDDDIMFTSLIVVMLVVLIYWYVYYYKPSPSYIRDTANPPTLRIDGVLISPLDATYAVSFKELIEHKSVQLSYGSLKYIQLRFYTENERPSDTITSCIVMQSPETDVLAKMKSAVNKANVSLINAFSVEPFLSKTMVKFATQSDDPVAIYGSIVYA